MATSQNIDVLVVGGGLGGVSAALAASSLGASVLLVESSNWLGGQLTAQGVGTPDEDALNGQAVVEMYGSTASYRDFKHRIREWYRNNATLSAAGQAQTLFNMGRCWVNTGFAVEPGVAVTIINQMLSEANVAPLLGATVSGSPLAGGRLIGDVTVTTADGTSTVVTAKFILDATETGDLLPMFGLGHVIGAEAQSDTGEPDAPTDGPHPEWVQPVTYPFALVHHPAGESYTIPEPANYDTIKGAQNFSLVDGAITAMFTGPAPFWTYRRIVDHTLFNDSNYPYDVATINVAANDYKGSIYPDDSNSGNNAAVLAAARQASLAYLYWLQTEAPRDDGNPSPGWPELMPATYFFNTVDSISPAPYIRESRRIKALYRVLEGDLSAANNPGMRAKVFADSCGIGNYPMDVHAGANGGVEVQQPTKPYQISVKSLVPNDCDNLIASGKCLGVTHITNGAYRLHPQEWNVGEAAGALAAFCVHTSSTPAQVVGGDPLLAQYQNTIMNRGVPLFWWSDVLGNPFWNHIQMCGARGAFQGDAGTLAFNPSGTFDAAAQADIAGQYTGVAFNWPADPFSRAQAAQVIANQMGWVQ